MSVAIELWVLAAGATFMGRSLWRDAALSLCIRFIVELSSARTNDLSLSELLERNILRCSSLRACEAPILSSCCDYSGTTILSFAAVMLGLYEFSVYFD